VLPSAARKLYAVFHAVADDGSYGTWMAAGMASGHTVDRTHHHQPPLAAGVFYYVDLLLVTTTAS
jgi:hypothetical protein